MSDVLSKADQKFLARILQDSAISLTFCKILAISGKNNALSYNILQGNSRDPVNFVLQINRGIK